jgi:hypothetical protein
MAVSIALSQSRGEGIQMPRIQSMQNQFARAATMLCHLSPLLRQPPPVVEDPHARRPVLRPGQRPRGRVDRAGREGKELGEIVCEPRGLLRAERRNRFSIVAICACRRLTLSPGGKSGPGRPPLLSIPASARACGRGDWVYGAARNPALLREAR